MSTVSSVSTSDYLNSLTSSSTGTSSTSADDDASTISQNEFLKILMTQLQYQDPLNPMDTEAFTSQLTSFSMLEQQINANSTLSEMADSLSSITQNNVIDYIGKDVTTSSNTLGVTDEGATSVRFSLDESADVTLTIYDSDGNRVTGVDYGTATAGTHDWTWDGTDSSGNAVEEGTYYYTVSAADASGNSVEVSTAEHGEVTGITYENGNTYLIVGGNTVSLDSILSVNETVN
jgi:flagellar basal-body rod modification protein FlgD